MALTVIDSKPLLSSLAGRVAAVLVSQTLISAGLKLRIEAIIEDESRAGVV